MRKKAQQPEIEVKKKELNDLITKTLSDLKTKMDSALANLNTQVAREVNTMTENLQKEIAEKLREIGTKSITVSPQQMANLQTADDKFAAKKRHKQKHLYTRDSEHNKDLPDFWRSNYDYGESPYMNIEKIEKITDKPPYKKKKKLDKSK